MGYWYTDQMTGEKMYANQRPKKELATLQGQSAGDAGMAGAMQRRMAELQGVLQTGTNDESNAPASLYGLLGSAASEAGNPSPMGLPPQVLARRRSQGLNIPTQPTPDVPSRRQYADADSQSPTDFMSFLKLLMQK